MVKLPHSFHYQSINVHGPVFPYQCPVFKKVKLGEVSGCLTVLDLCEAYGFLLHSPTVSSVNVNWYEVYGHFTVLDFFEAYDCFIALPCWF